MLDTRNIGWPTNTIRAWLGYGGVMRRARKQGDGFMERMRAVPDKRGSLNETSLWQTKLETAGVKPSAMTSTSKKTSADGPH